MYVYCSTYCPIKFNINDFYDPFFLYIEEIEIICYPYKSTGCIARKSNSSVKINRTIYYHIKSYKKPIPISKFNNFIHRF